MKRKIHEPYNQFKIWLRKNKLTYRDVAHVLGLSATSVCLKINGESDFLLCEIQAMQGAFQLKNDIFCRKCCLNDNNICNPMQDFV